MGGFNWGVTDHHCPTPAPPEESMGAACRGAHPAEAQGRFLLEKDSGSACMLMDFAVTSLTSQGHLCPFGDLRLNYQGFQPCRVVNQGFLSGSEVPVGHLPYRP